MQRYLCATCVVVLIAVISISGAAQAPPGADAYVTNTQPRANFGSSAFLPVQSGTTSYIRLNLGMLPANAVISKATLRLYVNAVAAPGSFDVYQVNSAWSEHSINLNNAPQLGLSATGGRRVSVTATSRNQFLLIDITPLAQAWANGSVPNYGIALAMVSASGSFSFDSKESTGTGHLPELDLVLGAAPDISIGVSTGSAAPAVHKYAGLQQPTDPYVDNGTTLQTSTNFNIDGTGSAASFNATSQYLMGGVPVLAASGNQSFFVGTQSGQSNTGDGNTFVGITAGKSNTSGSYNAFFGVGAGYYNTQGQSNLFIGTGAGALNTTGSYNTFIGSWAGQHNLTGFDNLFVGTGAGLYNTTGQYNTMFGTNSGLNNTTGTDNSFFGGASGYANTTGNSNVFFGKDAGSNNTTGHNNVYIGVGAGVSADPAAVQNVYIGTSGIAGENNTVRIGDPANQTAVYLAGVSGVSTSSGVPIFVDSNGKLGTGGGSVNFTQVTGTVTSPQLTGTYTNQVALSNTTNVIAGTFTGNGAGLAGVASGLGWPIVKKLADYAVQNSDFSTASTVGNFIILTGTVSHTFTLPNPPPPNGDCVALGNVADAGVNSGANSFLTVNSNGVSMDATTSYNPTHPRRASYMYCSDGTGYFRLGFAQNGVSEIGPWIKTYDTGTVNVMTSTFRNGMDFGLTDGTMIYLLPKFANTSNIVTLNLNGLGAFKVLKYGNQGLSPGDLSPNAYAHLIWNVNGQKWELINPQTLRSTLTGITGTIGGTALSAGACTTGTAAVTGAVVGHPVSVSASDGSLPNGLIVLSAAVTSANVVTVQLCAVAPVTPGANTYNVATSQ